MAGKCSRNGMRVDVWSYYSVDRPPVKFHRIRRSFDAPTDNYSGSIAGLTSDVFGLQKPCRAASLPSSLRPTRSPQSTARPNLTLSAQCINPTHVRVRNFPGPDPGSRHRCVWIIPGHLQNVSIFLFGLPNLFFSTAHFQSEGRDTP